MNSTAKVRFALIGAGVIGDVHARALTQLDTADLVAIADLDESKASIVAQKYGVEEATIDVENLLRRGDIDAVTICTPSGIHADLAVAALNAGKHVVVEKPIDVSLEAADRIVAAEKTSGKLLPLSHSIASTNPRRR